ncbi:MAG: hydantoinase/oxoprolinase family protein, partial [Rubrobacteridae bacterium]|nr:hydantoinase/oxoprolinase family protein [Rubrobacteridae bacterium]
MIIGIDVGGTFTDFVIWRDGKCDIHKILSTHPNPEHGVVNGLYELGVLDKTGRDSSGRSRSARALDGSDVLIDIIHGSTISTNALLERRGAKVGLITTDGFADIIDIGRQNRPHLYRFYGERPESLVQVDCRFGVKERVSASGEEIVELDEPAIRAALEKMRELEVESVAICFLFSFLDPKHEQTVEKIFRDNGYYVSASHKILPEFREYERFSTTIINAYVTPVMAGYINRLGRALGTAS